MKKLISILLVIVLVFTLSACSNNCSDSTSNTETNSTETIAGETENKSEDTDNTKDVTTESTESTENKTDNTTHEETKVSDKETSKDTEHKDSETTHSSNKTENNADNKNQNNSSQNTTKEETSVENTNKEENKTEAKPYYVGYELISIERPTTTYKVNGIPLLEKAYGTRYVLQVGDIATFKIIMSDGGNTGFSLRYKEGCDVKIEGNLLKITANTGYSEKTDVYINVDTKDGSVAIQLPRFINTKETIDYTDSSMAMQVNIFWEYATRKGLINTNLGVDLFEEIKERKIIDATNNPDWITEGFNMIDDWVKKGYTKFALIVDVNDGMSGSGGY